MEVMHGVAQEARLLADASGRTLPAVSRLFWLVAGRVAFAKMDRAGDQEVGQSLT